MKQILFVFLFCVVASISAKAQYKVMPVKSDTLTNAQPNSLAVVNPKVITKLKQLSNSFQAPNKLPLFCELEYQTSKLIKRRVKFGVEPK